MIWWPGLAPREFQFPFPGSLISTFLGTTLPLPLRLPLALPHLNILKSTDCPQVVTGRDGVHASEASQPLGSPAAVCPPARAHGLGFRVSGFGFRVSGFGFVLLGRV